MTGEGELQPFVRNSPIAAGHDRETFKFLRGLSFEEIEAFFLSTISPLR